MIIFFIIGIVHWEPTYRIKLSDREKGNSYLSPTRGDKFNKKMCIKPKAILKYFQMDMQSNLFGDINVGVLKSNFYLISIYILLLRK